VGQSGPKVNRSADTTKILEFQIKKYAENDVELINIVTINTDHRGIKRFDLVI
jgi:hypothetical protein